jgi:hypothetical protein
MTWTLIKKELRLHRNALYFATAILLIWGVLYIATCFADNPQEQHIPVVEILRISIFAFLVMIVVGLPLLVGASMVAWEHNEGLLESQLCLPVSRLRQWLVKVGVASSITLLFGGVLPFSMAELFLKGEMQTLVMDLQIAALALLLVALSSYFSTICRDSFSALLGSFLFCIAYAVVAGNTGLMLIYIFSLGDGLGVFAVRMLIVVVTLFLLAGHNFMAQGFSVRRVALHFAIICLLLAVLVLHFDATHARFVVIGAG